ncbi:MAG: ATP-dependent 6-phosphofructokinase [Alphaproteobacteria bacterium]|nr:ATP-dependent 6-phosphofructokinase [Alphaproteobacteria bacterium]
MATNRIGVLTSGGDCAGLNAVIRAVTKRAITEYGWEVYGINDGSHGLLDRPPRYQQLSLSDFSGTVLRLGGTILGSVNSGDPFDFLMPDGSHQDRSEEIIEGYNQLGLDALIAIGGDGSLAILRKLAQQGGWNLIGIPKTIDNDVDLTENAVGYLTAVDVATEALDRLQPTAASHNRVMILEVMGRDHGHIAINAGIAGGADAILIPEIPYDLDRLSTKLEDIRKQEGRTFALIVVAEGVKPVSDSAEAGIGQYLCDRLTDMAGAECRVTVLGHTQRGGIPTPRDRLFGSAFGVHAVDLIAAEKFDRMVAWSSRDCVDVPLADVVGHSHPVDPKSAVVRTARGLGICLGD